MSHQDWHDPNIAQAWDRKPTYANPLRPEQLDLLVTVLQDLYQPGQWTLDLGFGSGKVEELLFQRIPQARVVGVDSSPAMIELARQRLAPYEGRWQVVQQNLASIKNIVLPHHPYHYAIAVQALHHLAEAEMRSIYRFLHHVLEPGGWFLLLDRIRVNSPELWDAYQSTWRRLDRLHQSQLAEAEGQHFAAHEQAVQARGDFPQPLEYHLYTLRDSGFAAVACLHLHGNRALIAARKST